MGNSSDNDVSNDSDNDIGNDSDNDVDNENNLDKIKYYTVDPDWNNILQEYNDNIEEITL